MKRRSAKDKVFRPSKLWVYCPVIREIWVLGLWRKKWTEKDPSGWSFARGRSSQMIICKRPVHSDDHLQDRSIRMIICKRPVHPDDNLQGAGLSRWSFARGRSIQMIIRKRPIHPNDHSQEADPSEWSFARGRSIRMIICKLSLIHIWRCRRRG